MLSIHHDHIGSLLRPTFLVQAREDVADGRITQADFKASEDRAVDELIALQIQAGMQVITDGEARRLSFQAQLPEAVEGFGVWDVNVFLWGEWHGGEDVGDFEMARPPELGVVSKLRRKRHLCAEEFVYLRACFAQVLPPDAPAPVGKITLPSPSLWANFWSAEYSGAVYPTLDHFLSDVVDILRDEVQELARLGCTYLQLDAPHYPLLLDPKTRAFYEKQGWPLTKWLSYGIELDNAVIDSAPGVTFGFHLCRGNQGSRWLVAGGYDLIAQPIFRGIHAERLLLEYDDGRSGNFEPLRNIPDDKMVVLGLVTTKSGRRESQPELVRRIHEASQFVPLERLALSPQCGFATSVMGNHLSWDDERYKLRLVVDTANAVWG
ncbi:MAG TPA: cobalamin-independent methionine synthase II family protein [Caldilineaceae bacterium]|nr:cobalamin-independent methionine synthase II family protein [Caldilineaceae bacterium]